MVTKNVAVINQSDNLSLGEVARATAAVQKQVTNDLPSIKDNDGDVEYIAEICDPCQADECAYLVNGDQLVSDFVLPAFYKGSWLGKYSFANHIAEPRQVLPHGYMTWRSPVTDEWWQAFDHLPQFRALVEEALVALIRPHPAVEVPACHLSTQCSTMCSCRITPRTVRLSRTWPAGSGARGSSST
jgi:hypothetical protein